MKITVQPDCGDSPRKLFLKDWYMAIVNCDPDFVEKNIDARINWQIAGINSISGSMNFLSAFQQHEFWNAREFIIEAIITHGRDASSFPIQIQ